MPRQKFENLLSKLIIEDLEKSENGLIQKDEFLASLKLQLQLVFETLKENELIMKQSLDKVTANSFGQIQEEPSKPKIASEKLLKKRNFTLVRNTTDPKCLQMSKR